MTAGVLAALAVMVLAVGTRPRAPRDAGNVSRAPKPTTRRRQPRRGRPSARGHHTSDARDWARYLDAVAAHIRGGTSVRAAADAVLHAQPCRGAVVRVPLRLDLLSTAPIDDPDEAVVAQSLSTALQLGGPAASAVQAGANLLRERAAVRAEAHAHSAQARLSARVLTLVPLGFAVWSTAASTTFRKALVTPVGLTSSVLGLLTNAIGWWWMRRIVGRATA